MDVDVKSPAVNVAGGRDGFPQQNQAVSADGVPIGANGLDSAAGTGVPAFCPGIVTFTAGLCTVPTSMSSPSRILQIQGFVMLRDPCLFLRKSHVVSENFGGINMDLSALRTLEYASRQDKASGCKRHTPGDGDRSRTSAVSADAGAHRR